MRIIDADALFDSMNSLDYESTVKAYETIANAPTIDAVPINRCKTCYFWNTEANEPEDKKHGLCELNRIGTDDCFYCGAWTKDAHDFFNGDRDDWVSVVRCKDCVSFRYSGMGGDDGITYCAMGIEMQPTDFCSYGERKDDD